VGSKIAGPGFGRGLLMTRGLGRVVFIVWPEFSFVIFLIEFSSGSQIGPTSHC
jgi:hypothetical protein